MKIVRGRISLTELKQLARSKFGQLVKAVVDVEKQIMAVSGELHADEEALLLEAGSRQENLWGINLYPELTDEAWIGFDSVINLRPTQNNLSRGVDDSKIRKKIAEIVNNLVKR